jgi:hypothetical protein
MSRPVHYRRLVDPNLSRSLKQFRVAADARNHSIVRELLATAICIDCGERDPLVFQFDHLHDKSDHISWLVGSGCSPLRLARELLKCEIRCANCHRHATAQAGGWFRARQVISPS